jgi:hypothetical protein
MSRPVRTGVGRPMVGTWGFTGPSRQGGHEGNSDRVVGLLRGSPKGVVR